MEKTLKVMDTKTMVFGNVTKTIKLSKLTDVTESFIIDLMEERVTKNEIINTTSSFVLDDLIKAVKFFHTMWNTYVTSFVDITQK